jgi:peptidylprolyl isomerase
MTQVRTGDVVKLHFTGRLADGAVFGSSAGGMPLEFAAGTGLMFPKLNEAVLGMRVGERRTSAVTPDEGFGHRLPALQRLVPRGALPPGARVGNQLVRTDRNPPSRVWVRELGDEFAVVDENHPLAGETLEFDIVLVAIERGR